MQNQLPHPKIPALAPTVLSASRCDVYLARTWMLQARHGLLLDPSEQRRRTTYRFPADRDRFTLGAVLLRCVVGHTAASAPARVRIDRHCAICGGDHGRPRLPAGDGHVSVAHSGNLVAVAITGAGPVGIDVEANNSSAASEWRSLLPLLVDTPEPAAIDGPCAFLTVWTRKEAVLKATGDGLRVPMTQVRVSAPRAAPALLALRGAPPPPCVLRDVDAGPAHRAALAVLTRTTLAIAVHDAAPLLAAN